MERETQDWRHVENSDPVSQGAPAASAYAVATWSGVAIGAAMLIAAFGWVGSLMSVAPASCEYDPLEAERIYLNAAIFGVGFALLPVFVAGSIAFAQRTRRRGLSNVLWVVSSVLVVPCGAGALISMTGLGAC